MSPPPPGSVRPLVRLVHVVVPAHDEEGRIEQSLDAIADAMDAAQSMDLPVRCTLVLDHCEDQTLRRATAHLADPRFRLLECHARNVGLARDLGVRSTRTLGSALDPERVWVMSTDADTVVPRSWVSDQLVCAADHDLVVGAVVPESNGLPPALLRAWHRQHAPHGGRLHVHGANLGFRLSTYLAAGGFPHLTEHEDVALVRAILAEDDHRWCRATSVVTSSRHHGRVPGGFAGYLRALAARTA